VSQLDTTDNRTLRLDDFTRGDDTSFWGHHNRVDVDRGQFDRRSKAPWFRDDVNLIPPINIDYGAF
jgi:hypothetical protein